MSDRKCSLCGQYYTDETEHDKKECIERCEAYYNALRKRSIEAGRALLEARKRLEAQNAK